MPMSAPNEKPTTTPATQAATTTTMEKAPSNLSNEVDGKEPKEEETTSVPQEALDFVASSSSDEEESEEDSELDEEDDVSDVRNQKRRKDFFDRMARVSSMLLRGEEDAKLIDDTETDDEDDSDVITWQTDLNRPGRYIHIVTTAALPWMTGTAVNPLLRAAYLHERTQQINQQAEQNSQSNNTNSETKAAPPDSWVTLVIPWLELEEDQQKLYGQVFSSPKEQEAHVRKWLKEQAHMPGAAEKLKLVFYNARYHEGLGSVFAMGDIIQQLSQDQLDVCILEEPEHVNWYRAPGQGWTKRYNYVVGIVHTNYDQYATQHYTGMITAPAIRVMSAAMIRAYCHKVIKLSDALQAFAPEKEMTMNVHGVRREFIALASESNETTKEEPGTKVDDTASSKMQSQEFSTDDDNGDDVDEVPAKAQSYFIGKLLWTKGLDILVELEDYYRSVTGDYFPIDIYGSGPDQEEIKRAFLGRRQVYSDNDDNRSRTPSPGRRKKKLGIKNKTKQQQRDDPSILHKAVAWVHRGRTKTRRGKRDRQKKSTSMEDLYKDITVLLEALPGKAKESMETLPGTIDQFSVDLTSKAKLSMETIPAKAREALDQLTGDLTKVKARLEATTLPKTFSELRRTPIPAKFPGRVDHAQLKSKDHKIFINPSVSEVLCTTTFEALAMGKFAIIPVHPSNQFFLKFPNCLPYRNRYEFVANLQWALTHDPTPNTEDVAREFTWEAATDRLINAAAITHKEAREREMLGRSKMDERIAWFHNQLGKGVKGDVVRKVLGGGPISHQVKYEKQKQKTMANGQVDDEEEETLSGESASKDEEENEEEAGLYQKFQKSAFVQAIHQATANSITT